MHPVLDNPFRLLSLFSNATLSEVDNQVGMIRTSLRMGRQRKMVREIVLPELPQVERTVENVKSAAEELAMPVRRLAWARYWWMNATMTDDYALTCLEEGRVEVAKSAWERSDSWSALQNLLVLHLVQGETRDALRIAQQLYPSHAQELAKAVLGESYDAAADDGGERFLREVSYLAQQEVTDEVEKASPAVGEMADDVGEATKAMGAASKKLRDVSENLGDNVEKVGESSGNVAVSSPNDATNADIPFVVLSPNYEQRKKEREEQKKQSEIDREEFKRFMAESRAFRKKLKEDRKAYYTTSPNAQNNADNNSENSESQSDGSASNMDEKKKLPSRTSESIATNTCFSLAIYALPTMLFSFSFGIKLLIAAVVLLIFGTIRVHYRYNSKAAIERELKKRSEIAKSQGEEQYTPISIEDGCWSGMVMAFLLLIILLFAFFLGGTTVFYIVLIVLVFLMNLLV